MVISVYAATKVGKGNVNYDSFFIDRYVASTSGMLFGQFEMQEYLGDSDGFLLGVADGAGGMPDSDLISDIVCRSACESSALHGKNARADMWWHIRDILERGEAEIKNYYDVQKMNLACTFTAVKIIGSTVKLANIGDSPCMLVSGDSYKYLFREDTRAAESRNVKERTEGEQNQNVLTRCVSSKNYPDTDTFYFKDAEIKRNDVLIIASDSLTKGLTDPEIVDYFKKRKKREKKAINPALELVEKAYDKANDDTTVLVVEFE